MKDAREVARSILEPLYTWRPGLDKQRTDAVAAQLQDLYGSVHSQEATVAALIEADRRSLIEEACKEVCGWCEHEEPLTRPGWHGLARCRAGAIRRALGAGRESDGTPHAFETDGTNRNRCVHNYADGKQCRKGNSAAIHRGETPQEQK